MAIRDRVTVSVMVLGVRHRDIHRNTRVAHHGGEQDAQSDKDGQELS